MSQMFFLSLTSSKVLVLGNEKKNGFSFCISLAYSYLCIRNKDGSAHPKSASSCLLTAIINL